MPGHVTLHWSVTFLQASSLHSPTCAEWMAGVRSWIYPGCSGTLNWTRFSRSHPDSVSSYRHMSDKCKKGVTVKKCETRVHPAAALCMETGMGGGGWPNSVRSRSLGWKTSLSYSSSDFTQRAPAPQGTPPKQYSIMWRKTIGSGSTSSATQEKSTSKALRWPVSWKHVSV